jgi:hypothetical protein
MEEALRFMNANGRLFVEQPSGVWVPRFVDAKVSIKATTHLHARLLDAVRPSNRWKVKRAIAKRDRASLSKWIRYLLGDQAGMAGSFIEFWEGEMLDHFIGASAYSAPATLHFWASTTDPTNDGSGKTEPAVGAYARVGVTNNLTNFPASSGGAKSNASAILWIEATASWGNIGWIGAADDDPGGNDLFYGDITGGVVSVGDNQILRILAGDLDFTAD